MSALWLGAEAARATLVLAHGAGAGMRHAFLSDVSEALAARGIATLRYQFPYTEAGRRRPDPPALCIATVRAAVAFAAQQAPELPLFAGGKSFGGRMTSRAAAERPLPAVRGLVFVGFPLHPAGRPSSERGAHLRDVALPTLFLQGTRDALAEIGRVRGLCAALGAGAELREIEGADHSFHVPKRSGRGDAEVIGELAAAIADFAARIAGAPGA